MINNLFSEKYESNAWVYRYNISGQPYEANGYFPQALINFLVGISIKI
jgi:iron complex outermembrane receptor protein